MAAPMRIISRYFIFKNKSIAVNPRYRPIFGARRVATSDVLNERGQAGKPSSGGLRNVETKSFSERFQENERSQSKLEEQDVGKIGEIFERLQRQADEFNADIDEQGAAPSLYPLNEQRAPNRTKALLNKFMPETEQPKQVRKLPCRTQETDPANHGKQHCGMFYKVNAADANKWLFNVFHRDYYKTAKAFRETAIMIRQPGIELINYLKIADYNMPVVRYLLFGHLGAGKSHTMGHTMHYCAQQGWMIVHVRWLPQWSRYTEEIVPSNHNPNRFDTPREGVEWLGYFRDTNEELIKSHDLKFQHRYEWSKRESSEIGDSWMKAIEFGLGRPNYACDVVGALLKEMKLCAVQGKFKILVAVDGANGFFVDTVHRRDVTRAPVHATELTLTYNFKKLTRNDWTGGAIIGTVDDRAGDLNLNKSYLPKYLLQGEGGFEHFDPHIPIHVPHYDDKEVRSAINYYIENKWIQNPASRTDAGIEELIFMSRKNPLELYKTSRLW